MAIIRLFMERVCMYNYIYIYTLRIPPVIYVASEMFIHAGSTRKLIMGGLSNIYYLILSYLMLYYIIIYYIILYWIFELLYYYYIF